MPILLRVEPATRMRRADIGWVDLRILCICSVTENDRQNYQMNKEEVFHIAHAPCQKFELQYDLSLGSLPVRWGMSSVKSCK